MGIGIGRHRDSAWGRIEAGQFVGHWEPGSFAFGECFAILHPSAVVANGGFRWQPTPQVGSGSVLLALNQPRSADLFRDA